MTLRLATVNLFSGRSTADGRIDPARIVAGIAALDADVLAVQEVDRRQPRSGGDDQAATVARAACAREYRFVPLVSGTPGVPGWRPAAEPPDGGADGAGQDGADGAGQDGADGAGPDGADAAGQDGADAARGGGAPSYGIAVVSRLPVTGWHVLRLAPGRGRWPIAVPTRPPRVLWLPDEPRAVLAAELDDPPMVVAGTHLSFVPGVNVRQLRQARRWLTALAAGRPLVLMGDLNLPGPLPARLTGWTPLVTGRTFPTPAPRVQLDHVLAAGLPPGPGTAGRPVELPFGDHHAVVADLRL